MQLKPGMLSDLTDRVPLVRVLIQDASNQVDSLWGKTVRFHIFSFDNLLVQEGRIGVFKGQKTAQKSVHDNTTTPHVNLIPMIFQTSDHFRCGIARTSTGCLQHFTIFERVTEAKINDLDVQIVV